MSIEVRTVEQLLRHYESLLDECSESVMVIESWGLSLEEEKGFLKDARGWWEDLLVDGVEKI